MVGMVAGSSDVACAHCGSSDVAKLVSKFARYRNEDDRVDEIAERLETMGEPESATEMRSIVRELGKAMDEDVSEEMEEVFESDMSGDAGSDDE